MGVGRIMPLWEPLRCSVRRGICATVILALAVGVLCFPHVFPRFRAGCQCLASRR
jgi:hypothetical protein